MHPLFLVNEGTVAVIGRSAKARAREIREKWDSSSRDIGNALRAIDAHLDDANLGLDGRQLERVNAALVRAKDLRWTIAEDRVRAAEAVALFCYDAKKWIGSFAAALGGLDTLVFAGGIGENAPLIRERICEGLGFLGIELDEKRNVANAGVISSETSRTSVHMIRTDEESVIASMVCRVLGLTIENGTPS